MLSLNSGLLRLDDIFDVIFPIIAHATVKVPEPDILSIQTGRDRHAAFRKPCTAGDSCFGQVMGYNAAMAGFASGDDMVSAMQKAKDEQLAASLLRDRKLHALLALSAAERAAA